LPAGEEELEMTPMSLPDWPRDQQIVLEVISDYLCHRLLTLISPTYRVLEALGDPRAQEMKDAIRKRVEEGEWFSGQAAKSDSAGPHAPDNAQEQ
jgi:hypothetical protein